MGAVALGAWHLSRQVLGPVVLWGPSREDSVGLIWFRDVIVKLPLGLKILTNQFHAPQAHVVVGGSGGIRPHNFFCFLDAKWCILRPF